jgi:hypothetical protein
MDDQLEVLQTEKSMLERDLAHARERLEGFATLYIDVVDLHVRNLLADHDIEAPHGLTTLAQRAREVVAEARAHRNRPKLRRPRTRRLTSLGGFY